MLERRNGSISRDFGGRRKPSPLEDMVSKMIARLDERILRLEVGLSEARVDDVDPSEYHVNGLSFKKQRAAIDAVLKGETNG